MSQNSNFTETENPHPQNDNKLLSLKFNKKVGRVDGLSLHLETDATVIAGPNGIGKTTILHAIRNWVGTNSPRHHSTGESPIAYKTKNNSYINLVFLVGNRDGRHSGPGQVDHEGQVPDGSSFVRWFDQRDIAHARFVRDTLNADHRDPQLSILEDALKRTDAFRDVKISVSGGRLLFNKKGEDIYWGNLSSGERSIFTMFGVISQCIGTLSEPQSSPSILVLIDEVDLHLHPAWQRRIVPLLTSAFPTCQFIVTTHSPQVVGSVEARCVRLLSEEENGKTIAKVPMATKGIDSNFILETLMNSEERAPEADELIHQIVERIGQNRFDEARIAIENLRQLIEGDAPIFSRLNLQVELGSRRAKSVERK